MLHNQHHEDHEERNGDRDEKDPNARDGDIRDAHRGQGQDHAHPPVGQGVEAGPPEAGRTRRLGLAELVGL